MKAIEKYLYSRNGYFYYRSSLPRYLHSPLARKEITIALASQDLGECRILAAKLNYEKTKLLKTFQDHLRSSNPPENTLPNLIEELDKLKSSVGYEQPLIITDSLMSKEEKRKSPLFSEVAEQYMKDCTLNAHRTKLKKESAYALFIELMGDLPFHSVGTTEAREFKSLLQIIPANAKKMIGGKSLRDIDWKNSGQKPQHPKTINNNLACIIALFNWSSKNGYYKEANPFSGLIIKNQKSISTKFSPFKPEELATLIQCPVFTGHQGVKWAERLSKGTSLIKDSLYWIPLIGLYSGMRMNEICQLDLEDIQNINGIYVFDINDDSNGKTLKTSSSKRIVPIHQKLIDKGLLDYISQTKREGHTRLFTDIERGANMSYSHVFSKRFRRLLDVLKLERKGLCFHSFRHTFIDGLRNAEIDRAIVMTLVGHQPSKDVHGGYGNGYNLAILQKSINRLSFPYLEE